MDLKSLTKGLNHNCRESIPSFRSPPVNATTGVTVRGHDYALLPPGINVKLGANAGNITHTAKFLYSRPDSSHVVMAPADMDIADLSLLDVALRKDITMTIESIPLLIPYNGLTDAAPLVLHGLAPSRQPYAFVVYEAPVVIHLDFRLQ